MILITDTPAELAHEGKYTVEMPVPGMASLVLWRTNDESEALIAMAPPASALVAYPAFCSIPEQWDTHDRALFGLA